MRQQSFWQEHNAWWRQAAAKMAASTKAAEWGQARHRLRDLLPRVPGAGGLSGADAEDLVQTTLMKLLDEAVCWRVAAVDAPAHYIARMIGNHLRDEAKAAQVTRRAERGYAQLEEAPRDERPDALAEWEELQTAARRVVNHEVSRRDRIALWGWARGKTLQQIARELKCSVGSAAQQLSRARKRLRDRHRKKFSG